MEEARISNIARTSFEVEKNTIERSFFYDNWDVIEEREKINGGTELVTKQYVEGSGQDEHVCVDYYNSTGDAIEKIYFFVQNHRNDVVAIVDSTGSLVKRYIYSPYGIAYETDKNGVLSNADFSISPYGYHGRRIDQETGNWYFRHRYYNAKQGSFLQRDPLGYIDSMNLYNAFGNNPVNYSDVFGLFSTYKKIQITKEKIIISIKYVISRTTSGKREHSQSKLERLKRRFEEDLQRWNGLVMDRWWGRYEQKKRCLNL